MKRTLLSILLVLCLLAALLPAAAAGASADEPSALGGGGRTTVVDVSALLIQEGGAPAAVSEPDPNPALNAALRQRILAGLRAWSAEISLRDLSGITPDMLSAAYTGALNDNPELFYVGGTFSYSQNSSGITRVIPSYQEAYTPEDVERFRAVCASVAEQMPEGRTEYKYLWLHDYLVTHCVYDDTLSRHNAYHALVEGDAVCQGYALAYIALCRAVGLDASYISSRAMVHGWNVVTLYGKQYYIDCTWDDPGNWWEGVCLHENFLRSRDGMAETNHDSTDWVTVEGTDAYNGIDAGTEYDSGAWWATLTAPVANLGSTFAYALSEDNANIHLRSAVSDTETTVAHGKTAKWYVWGGTSDYYTTNFMIVVSEGNSFYFNTSDTIWRMTEDGAVSQLYTLSEEERQTGWIYQMKPGVGCLYYGLNTAPTNCPLSTPLVAVSTGSPVGQTLEVDNEDELYAALNSAFPVSEIRITGDMTLEKDCRILYRPGYLQNYADTLLTIQEGVTVEIEAGGVLGSAWYTYEGDGQTGPQPNGQIVNNGTILVKDGGTIEGELKRNNGSITVASGGQCVVVTQNYGDVTVCCGGEYRTTQGNEAYNYGSTTVEDGAVLEARFGSTLHNKGTLTVDGVFFCNCVGADNADTDTLWFDNEGTVNGSGRIFVCEADHETMPVRDLDGMLSQMRSLVGGNSGPDCYKLADVGSEADLSAALEDALTSAVRLTQDVTVSGQIRSLGLVLVPEGVTLNLEDGAWLNAQLLILPGGETIVEDGAALATTQAGPRCILNHGTLTVEAGGELQTIFGGELWNAADGCLVLNGTFSCGGYADETGSAHIWFDNQGSVTGSGLARMEIPFDRNSAGETEQAALLLIGALDSQGIRVQVRAELDEELCLLNDLAGVDSILLTGGNNPRISVSGELRLTKELQSEEGVTLLVNPGAALTAEAPMHLSTLALQGSLILSGEPVTASLLLYGNTGSVTGGTIDAAEEQYEYLIDIDNGDVSGQQQLFLPAGETVCLESISVPSSPEQAGLVFDGWEFTSGWSSVTAEELAAIGITEQDGRHFLVMPDFPITMTARWIDAGPVIITQPVDYVGAEGSTASFSVVAQGEGPLTYQWWIRNPGENEFTKSTRKTATYSTTLKAASSGRELYCVVTDAGGNSVTSDTVTMTIEPAALTITQQPVDYVGAEGSTASFTVVAQGAEPLSYQWWIRNPGENEFTKSTRKTATYSTTLKAASNGRELYCVVTDAGGNSVISDTVTMTIEPAALTITQQPVDYVGAEGSTAAFTVVAEGAEPLTYQWWIRNPGENEFTKSTRRTATYSTTLKAASSGRELYCVVTDANGNSVQTDVVTMTIEPAGLTITQQPVDYVGAEGSTASFTVVAEGKGPLTYQWWIRNPGENEFAKSTRKTATYSTTLKAASSGRELYCVVTDANGNSVQTDVVTMTIEPAALTITQQPVDYVGAEGSTASFTVVAEGEGPLTYQWWIRNPGENEFKKSTRRTATYSTTLKAASSGRELYCVVTDAGGNSVTSDVVTMTIEPAALAITQQPVDYVGAEGSTASFTVVAEGKGPLTYQWWIRNPGENEFKKSTRKTATYSTTLKAASSGRELYCVVTDAAGNSVTTDVVTMTIG